METLTADFEHQHLLHRSQNVQISAEDAVGSAGGAGASGGPDDAERAAAKIAAIAASPTASETRDGAGACARAGHMRDLVARTDGRAGSLLHLARARVLCVRVSCRSRHICGEVGAREAAGSSCMRCVCMYVCMCVCVCVCVCEAHVRVLSGALISRCSHACSPSNTTGGWRTRSRC